jgi:polyisoprenoid-binding protein YceI
MHFLALVLVLSATIAGQSPTTVKKIDTHNSKITIHAYKSGMFSFAAHDHVISAPIAAGQVDEAAGSVEFTVRTAEMQVLDPEVSDKDRSEIRTTMLGDKLLDAAKYPEASFRSTRVTHRKDDASEVAGVFTLHGVKHDISFLAKKQGNAYVGETTLKQSDYGMKPVSVAGGTVKVKDEVKIDFNVVLE